MHREKNGTNLFSSGRLLSWGHLRSESIYVCKKKSHILLWISDVSHSFSSTRLTNFWIVQQLTSKIWRKKSLIPLNKSQIAPQIQFELQGQSKYTGLFRQNMPNMWIAVFVLWWENLSYISKHLVDMHLLAAVFQCIILRSWRPWPQKCRNERLLLRLPFPPPTLKKMASKTN